MRFPADDPVLMPGRCKKKHTIEITYKYMVGKLISNKFLKF